MLAKYIQKVARRIAVPVDKFANYCWFNFPFGITPRAEREMYEKLALEELKSNMPKLTNMNVRKFCNKNRVGP